MNVSRWAVVIIGCLLFFGVGFIAGGYVEAGALGPGSAGDPLAAKSYVEKAVTAKISKLQTQADALQTKITNLQQTVDKIQTEVSSNQGSKANTLEVSQQTPAQTKLEQVKAVSVTIATGKVATVTASSVNVRKGPGADTVKVSGLLKGQTVKVLKIETGWVNVDLGAGVTGWISKDLVEIK